MSRTHNHYRNLSPRDKREIARGMPVLGLPAEYRPDTRIRGMQGPEPLRIRDVDEILSSNEASASDLATLEEHYGDKVRLIEPRTILDKVLGERAIHGVVQERATEAA